MRRGWPSADDIYAGDLRLFAAVLRVRRHDQRFAVRAQDGAGAFVKPFRRGADLSRRRASAFEPQRNIFMLSVSSLSASPCIACRFFALPRCVRPVPDTRQRRFRRMIDRRQQPPLGRAGVDRIVVEAI